MPLIAIILLKKTRGKLSGFIAYTLSRTTRQFDAINQGDSFLFAYDRPHSLALHANYLYSDSWSFSASWYYHTGQPFTPIIGREIIPVEILQNEVQFDQGLIYGKRNSYRMSDYHRLDLAAVHKVKSKKGRNAEWTFSIYNAYCRLNANSYSYGYGQETNSGTLEKNKLYKTSFFPIIPSISYKVYF